MLEQGWAALLHRPVSPELQPALGWGSSSSKCSGERQFSSPEPGSHPRERSVKLRWHTGSHGRSNPRQGLRPPHPAQLHAQCSKREHMQGKAGMLSPGS